MHAQASASATIPVTVPFPSMPRQRSITPAIGVTSVIGSPSIQWACSGQARSSAVQTRSSRRRLSGRSPDAM
jgi:hypothetical protein